MPSFPEGYGVAYNSQIFLDNPFLEPEIILCFGSFMPKTDQMGNDLLS